LKKINIFNWEQNDLCLFQYYLSFEQVRRTIETGTTRKATTHQIVPLTVYQF